LMIFLHSSFRVSSTWLWSRFRCKDQVLAYYEVFNEQLANTRRTDLASLSADCWHSKHPPGPPYFLEFLPLAKRSGGIQKYEPIMAFDLFIPPGGIGGAISKAEKAYLGSLIGRAENLGKIPVLSCKRSLGRMRGMKSAFPGFHVLIYRNLFQQWCSYTGQYLRGQPFFFDSIRRTIEANQHDSFFRRLHDLFPLETLSIDSSSYFYCFVLLHLYLYAQVVEAADLVLNVNRVAADGAYREAIERQIAEETQLAIDLSDAKTTIAFCFAELGSVEHVADQLYALGDLVISTSPSMRGKEFALECMADLIEEYKQYNFYVGTLAAECQRLSKERDGVVLERDRLRTELERQARAKAPLRKPLRALRDLFSYGQTESYN
jgi:hypothetical protein